MVVGGSDTALNSIDPNIQFTFELEDTEGQGLPFLDTITTRSDMQIQVNVYRKPTHTDRYLDFHSHYPLCHRRSVVNALRRRGRNIPSTLEGKRLLRELKIRIREVEVVQAFQPILWLCRSNTGTIPSEVSMSRGSLS